MTRGDWVLIGGDAKSLEQKNPPRHRQVIGRILEVKPDRILLVTLVKDGSRWENGG